MSPLLLLPSPTHPHPTNNQPQLTETITAPCPRQLPPPGNCGISVDLPAPTNKVPAGQEALAALFAEELGLVLEVRQRD